MGTKLERTIAGVNIEISCCRATIEQQHMPCFDHGMKIKMSRDAADKLAACFAWACTSTDPAEQRYFDAYARCGRC